MIYKKYIKFEFVVYSLMFSFGQEKSIKGKQKSVEFFFWFLLVIYLYKPPDHIKSTNASTT